MCVRHICMYICIYKYESVCVRACLYMCTHSTDTQSCVHWKYKRPTSPCTFVREYTKRSRIFLSQSKPYSQKKYACMHSHASLDLKLFLEDLRTNAELFMRSLNWLEASWELEDPQHRSDQGFQGILQLQY